MKKYLLLVFVLILSGILLSLLRLPPFEALDRKLYDLHFTLRGPRAGSGRIVLVTIDEKSLTSLGRWPWPRRYFGELFEKLIQNGAQVVSPDLFFTEPSQESEGRQNDLLLAKTFREHDNIFTGYYMLLTEEKLKESTLSNAVLEENFGNLKNVALSIDFHPPKIRNALGLQDTLPMLSNLPGVRQGFFNILTDPDGTVRSTPAVIAYRDRIFPSLPLQIALFVLTPPLPEWFDSLILNEEGDFLINWRGKMDVFPRISASDVMEGKIPFSLRKKLIIVGATASGLEDSIPTPLETRTPSSVVTANILENLMEGDILRSDSMTVGLSRALILAVGLGLGFLLFRLKPLEGLVAFLIVTLAQMGLFHLLFLKWRWVLPQIYPLFSGFLVYGGTTIYRYLSEEKEKRFIRETFGHYLSTEVIEELTRNPEKVRLGGERKELTVFFSDLRDFSGIVESTPADLVTSFLNSYLTPVTDVILRSKGLLDKYIGDAVMAVFGVPLPDPDHRLHACQAAIEIARLVKTSQETWQREFHLPKIKIGIGINTGTVTVGNMGSERRFDYTVIGDGVNLASRLEGLNKFYHTTILVSQTTYEPVKDHFHFRELDEVRVKGKKEKVHLYELLVDPSSEKEGMLTTFREGLSLYREGDFGEARARFERCLATVQDDGPSQLLFLRCKKFEAHPPADWSGITEFLRK